MQSNSTGAFGTTFGANSTAAVSGFSFGTPPVNTGSTATVRPNFSFSSPINSHAVSSFPTPAFGTPATNTPGFSVQPTSNLFTTPSASTTGFQLGSSTSSTQSTGLFGSAMPPQTGIRPSTQASQSTGLFSAVNANASLGGSSSLFSAKLPATTPASSSFGGSSSLFGGQLSATTPAIPASTSLGGGSSLFSAQLPANSTPQAGASSLFSGFTAPASRPSFPFGGQTNIGTPRFGPPLQSTLGGNTTFGSASLMSSTAGPTSGTKPGLSFSVQESGTATKPGFSFGSSVVPTTQSASAGGSTPVFVSNQPVTGGFSFASTAATATTAGVSSGFTFGGVSTTSSTTKPSLTLAGTIPSQSGTTGFKLGGANQSGTTGFTLGGTKATTGLTSVSTTSSIGTPQSQPSAVQSLSLNQSTTGFNFSGQMGGLAKTTGSPVVSSDGTKTTSVATPALSLGNTSKTAAASTTSSLTTSTTLPAFGLSMPSSITATSSSGLSFGLAATTSAGIGLKVSSTSTTATTSSTAASALTAASTEKYSYKQLEEQVNKWNIELEEMEKAFLEQAAQVNVADRELMENGEKIGALHSEVERAKEEQNRLDQELDFLVSQQNELEDLLKPLEDAVKQHSAEYVQEPDREREKIYTMAEKCDGQLKGMVQDLREIIDYLNASNASQQDDNPVVQIAKILNVHMDSLQWIDRNSALLQKRVDEIAHLNEIRQREHERAFRIGFS